MQCPLPKASALRRVLLAASILSMSAPALAQTADQPPTNPQRQQTAPPAYPNAPPPDVVAPGRQSDMRQPGMPAASSPDMAAEDPAQVTIAGEVQNPTPDGFGLDYGGGVIRVALDEIDWAGNPPIEQGQIVMVSGDLEDALFERSMLDATGVYVQDTGAHILSPQAKAQEKAQASQTPGHGMGEQGMSGHGMAGRDKDRTAGAKQRQTVATLQPGMIMITGPVADVRPDARSFTIETGQRDFVIDTDQLSRASVSPPRVAAGDRVMVTAMLPVDWIVTRRVEARKVVPAAAVAGGMEEDGALPMPGRTPGDQRSMQPPMGGPEEDPTADEASEFEAREAETAPDPYADTDPEREGGGMTMPPTSDPSREATPDVPFELASDADLPPEVLQVIRDGDYTTTDLAQAQLRALRQPQ